MNKKQILTTGIIGITGAILMFIGDMLLYYTSAPITSFEEEIVPIMGGVSFARLTIGGLLGPLCASMYLIGYYQVYLAIKPTFKKMAMIVFTLLGVAIIFGGAFHSHFAHMGFVSHFNYTDALEVIQEYAITTYFVTIILNLLGYVLLTYLVLTNKTYYPKWIILCSPLVLIWFSDLVQLLPQPFKIFIAGGWSNITAIIFFIVSTRVLLKHTQNESKSHTI